MTGIGSLNRPPATTTIYIAPTSEFCNKTDVHESKHREQNARPSYTDINGACVIYFQIADLDVDNQALLIQTISDVLNNANAATEVLFQANSLAQEEEACLADKEVTPLFLEWTLTARP